MIRALIIDDEESGCEVLESLLNLEHPDVEIVQLANSVTEGIKAINKHQPDLIFLDIKLNGKSGFEILEATKDGNYQVIFVSAYGDYALKAIKASALDYLLKPVSRTELKEALNRARQRISSHTFPEIKSLLQRGLRPEVPKMEEKLAIPTSEGYELFPASQILYLIADRNYTKVFFSENAPKVTTKTLGAYEEQLSKMGFLRIHRSYMVNLNYVKLYSPGNGGYIKMTDNRRLEVSRRKKKELLERINLENHPETA